MIYPNQPQTAAAVAAHYDELDPFYREVWGEHVHHGYWATGRESPEAADRGPGRPRGRPPGAGPGPAGLRHRLRLRRHRPAPGRAPRRRTSPASPSRRPRQRWPPPAFPHGAAFPSTSRTGSPTTFPMPASTAPTRSRAPSTWRTSSASSPRPAARSGPAAGSSSAPGSPATDPRPWEVRWLLEPICREGRLPGMGDEADYRRLARAAGLHGHLHRGHQPAGAADLVDLRGAAAGKVATQPRYARYLMDRRTANRVFALTLVRLLLAYRTGSMRYGLMVFERPR